MRDTDRRRRVPSGRSGTRCVVNCLRHAGPHTGSVDAPESIRNNGRPCQRRITGGGRVTRPGFADDRTEGVLFRAGLANGAPSLPRRAEPRRPRPAARLESRGGGGGRPRLGADSTAGVTAWVRPTPTTSRFSGWPDLRRARVTRRPAGERVIKAVEYDGVRAALAAAQGDGFRGQVLYMTALGVNRPSFMGWVLNRIKGNRAKGA